MTRESFDERLRAAFDQGQAKIAPLSKLGDVQASIHAMCFKELHTQLGGVFGERDMLLGIQGYVDDPSLVVTGDLALLVAMARLYPTGDYGPRLIPLLDADYDAFAASAKEPREFQWHVRWWSRFSAPRAPGDGMPPTGAKQVCVHDLGILWGPHHGFETSSLWRVDGDALELEAQDYTGKRF